MIRFFSAVSLQLVFALALFASPVAAHAATDERADLAVQFSQELLSLVDLTAVMEAALEEPLKNDAFMMRPEWPQLMKDAFHEQFVEDKPFLVALMGREMAKGFTVEELRIGLEFLKDPAARAAFKAGVTGETPDPEPKISARTIRLLDSTAGRSLLDKLSRIDQLMKGLDTEFAAGVVPGVFRRFGEKTEALELQRRAAAGLPAPAR